MEGSIICTLHLKRQVFYLTSLKELKLHELFVPIHEDFSVLHSYISSSFTYINMDQWIFWIIIQQYCVWFCFSFDQWKLLNLVLVFIGYIFISVRLSSFIWVFTKACSRLILYFHFIILIFINFIEATRRLQMTRQSWLMA